MTVRKMGLMWVAATGLAAGLAMAPAAVIASEHEPVFDVYSLSASAQGDVDNDLLRAELVVEDEDRDAAALANRINAAMGWALNEMLKFPTVEEETAQYSTWPQYERKQNRIIGWHASQVLKLESSDFDAARKAIKVLQERLQVRSMMLTTRVATRQAREDELISEALDAFRERALQIQLTMGAQDFRIMQVDVQTSDRQPSYRSMERGYSMAESKVAAEPAIAPGTSNVRVTVSGRIQLQ